MTRLLLLALATIAGLIGMFMVGGMGEVLFFLLASLPAAVGTVGYIGRG